MSAAADRPDDKLLQAYDEQLRQLLPDQHPENHQGLAAWCRERHWETEAAFHDQEADLQLAVLELQKRQALIKEGDAKALKRLVVWAKTKLPPRHPGIRAAAEQLLRLDPNCAEAHEALGHLPDGKTWVDPWELLVRRGGLENAKVRYQMHQQLTELYPEPTRLYTQAPTAGLAKVDPAKAITEPGWKKAAPLKDPPVGFWRVSFARRDGRGDVEYLLWVPPAYDPAKAWPVIVVLQGGGGQGTVEDYLKPPGKTRPDCGRAATYVAIYANWYGDREYIVVAPLVRVDCGSMWFVKENMLNVVDTISQACVRLHIDRRRIYLTGHSAGGWGATHLNLVAPELFAAVSAENGMHYHRRPLPDLTGRALLVFNSGDKGGEMKDYLAAGCSEARMIAVPGAPHSIEHEKTKPQLFDFFGRHTSGFAPDLELVRRLIEQSPEEKGP
jgi:predicted esterase